MTPDRWPPSGEELDKLARIAEVNCTTADRRCVTGECEWCGGMARLFRDPRLKAALELQEAMEWIEANYIMAYHGVGTCECRRSTWGLRNSATYLNQRYIRATTIPAAVTALRAKLAEKEGGDRG